MKNIKIQIHRHWLFAVALLLFAGLRPAVADTFSFATDFTDIGTTLTSANFTASGSSELNIETGSDGTGAYLNNNSIISGTSQTMTVALANASFASFELTGILFDEFIASADFDVYVVGTKLDNSTVTSSVASGSGSFDTYSVNLSNFSGVQLKSFLVNITTFGTSFDNLSLTQFNATLSAVPEPSGFAMVVGMISLGAVATKRRRRV